ncbi:hypothetical protein [Tritonibacter litoralis]|uniref:hypothetical protein n=1 Tax=Tritonibacter litoralis TaxID=2662264 RepID=UPI00129225D0|nr:hypothetical protein [Tritonibacter litoralis]
MPAGFVSSTGTLADVDILLRVFLSSSSRNKQQTRRIRIWFRFAGRPIPLPPVYFQTGTYIHIVGVLAEAWVHLAEIFEKLKMNR